MVALGLGSNLDRPAAQLQKAVERLRSRLMGPRVSPLYRTEPQGGPPQADYLNLVVLGHTDLSPEDLLAWGKSLERAAGRRPTRSPNTPRPLDVDLLLYGDAVIESEELTVPHPRLRQRRFVLEPLSDLEPDLELPPDGATVAAVLWQLGEGGGRVRKISWPEARHL